MLKFKNVKSLKVTTMLLYINPLFINNKREILWNLTFYIK